MGIWVTILKLRCLKHVFWKLIYISFLNFYVILLNDHFVNKLKIIRATTKPNSLYLLFFFSFFLSSFSPVGLPLCPSLFFSYFPLLFSIQSSLLKKHIHILLEREKKNPLWSLPILQNGILSQHSLTNLPVLKKYFFFFGNKPTFC